MLPTIDIKDNLLLLDCFTPRFIRNPRKGEIVVAINPYKSGATLVKRVINTEGEMAEFFSPREGKNVKVQIPKGHIWIEGDNKD